MRIKQDGTRYLQDRNTQDFPVKILQLPTAQDVAAKYATLAGFAAYDLTTWRMNYDKHLDPAPLDDLLTALNTFAAYLESVKEAI